MINDSGNRTKFESGAVRDIQEGKGRCDLLPLHVVSMWLGDPIFGMIEQYREKPAFDPTPKSTRMVQILSKFTDEHRNTNDTCKSKERYRYDLVLEVAKHFEEGAKKYGDRNWEKGIPCDRYIDSAVRHYCKWRAGWDDEPHDRAFIWNILCCEWTRQRYGWNLERVGEKSDAFAIKEFIDKIGTGDFAEKAHKLGDPVIPILTGMLHYDRLMSGSLEKTASDMADNPYVKGTDDGWKFYSVDGILLGYIFKFKEPSKQKRQQLDILVKKVWHEVTDNVYTMKKIIEERDYICGKDFSICIAPSVIAKEYDFCNRKYNEED